MTPETLKKINTLFADLRATHARQQAETAALREREQAIFGGEDYSLAIKAFDPEHDAAKIAEDMTARLVYAAIDAFSPAGGVRLDIDRAYVVEALGMEEDPAGSFDAVRLWEYLDTHYGGVKGHAGAYKQAATLIVGELGLARANATRRRGAFIVLEQSAYVDSWDKKAGRVTLSYGSRESVSKLLSALQSFAVWAERAVLELDLAHVKYSLADYHTVVKSRQSYPCDDGEFSVVTYHGKFEYLFSPALAERLQIFVSEFGQAALKRAA